MSLFSARTNFASTGADDKHGKVWIKETDQTYLVFGVKACFSAKVALTEWRGPQWEENSYVIVIGNAESVASQKSLIRFKSNGDNMIIVDTPSILSCDETRFFWVSWKDHLIEVGQGTRVGNQRFMHWLDEDKHFTISAANVHGGGNKLLPAQWRIDAVEGTTAYFAFTKYQKIFFYKL